MGHGDEDPEQLLANPANWRIHPKAQQEALIGVLDEVGWVSEVIVNRASGHVVDGHLRVSIALGRNEPTIPVKYVELSPAEEALVLATIDPIAAMAGTDAAKLDDLLRDVSSASPAVQEMLGELAKDAGLYKTAGQTDPDEVPEVPEAPYVKPGDLYALGDHRLLCGDSTNAEDVARLFAGERAIAVFTDPPYGVGYDGGTKVRERLVGDDTPGLYELALPGIPVTDQASLYLCFPMAHAPVVYKASAESGWKLRNVLVWNKNQAQFGALSAHYHDKYEPILYATRGTPMLWYGPTNEVTVWDIDRARSNDLHPTQKPVELVARALGNSTAAGDLVADLFSGSGSTIIAAEQLGRRCYAMELEPKYVQVALERWEAFTGRKAELLP